MLIPGATPEQMTWVDALMRTSTSTENAVEFRRQRRDVDVTALLTGLDLPTLVMHARGDQMVDLSNGRLLAAGIPGARLITLESDNHVLLADEPAWPVFRREVTEFLSADTTAAAPAPTTGAARTLDLLSTREREVLRLVAAGQDNRDIAEALSLSPRTVERHLQTIYRKLELTGSAQRTAAAALLLGLDDYASTA
jgi:DNA-binding CsgD family transcriptional regulator